MLAGNQIEPLSTEVYSLSLRPAMKLLEAATKCFDSAVEIPTILISCNGAFSNLILLTTTSDQGIMGMSPSTSPWPFLPLANV